MEAGAHAARPSPDDGCRTLPRRRSRSMPNCSLWFDIAALPSSSGCFPLWNFAACGRPRLRGWRPLQAQGREGWQLPSPGREHTRGPQRRPVGRLRELRIVGLPWRRDLPPRSLIRVLGPRGARAMERASVTCISGEGRACRRVASPPSSTWASATAVRFGSSRPKRTRYCVRPSSAASPSFPQNIVRTMASET